MQYLAIGCRAAIVVVFLAAVASKVVGKGSFSEFTDSVAAMRVVSRGSARAVALASVTAEGLTVVLAASPVRAVAVAGCALAGLLSITFSAAIAVSLRRGNRAPCRCFGRSATPLGARHLARNSILLIVSAVGTAACLQAGVVHLPGVIVATGSGLFAGIIIAAYDDIAELLAPVPR